jgi:hypothetical protein
MTVWLPIPLEIEVQRRLREAIVLETKAELERMFAMTEDTEPIVEAPDAPDDNPSEPADDPVPEPTEPVEEPKP